MNETNDKLVWKKIGLLVNKDLSCKEIADNMNSESKRITPVGNNKLKAEKLQSLIHNAFKSENGNRILATIGHGGYHHLTYGLCKRADILSSNYCYVHFDHHCDSWRYEKQSKARIINCANFVPYILEETHASSVLFLGSHPDLGIKDDDNYVLKNRHMSLMENKAGHFNLKTLEFIVNELGCDDVYISCDLDVMIEDEIITSYDRGSLRKNGLLEAISVIKEKKRIIGADIVGYSTDRSDISRTIYAITGPIHIEGRLLLPIKDYKICLPNKDSIRLKEKSMKLYEDIASLITK